VDTEKIVPILPCRTLDDVVPFYEALGFEITYRQARPNPYVAFRRGGLDLHFFGLDAHDPAGSLGNVLLVVPDTAALFDDFAAGLRGLFGALPTRGIPRITRPRRKQGIAGGFTVVDPGGNWVRVTSGSDDDADPPEGGVLQRVLENAARQGDARGDETRAIAVLDTGLARHPDAPWPDRLPVLLYLVELLARTGDAARAAQVAAEIRSHGLDPASDAVLTEIEASLQP
jgi:hypothetical protein